MKWVLSQQTLEHHRWLLQDTLQPAQFTYSLSHHSIRIKSNSSRLFFMEVTGRFQKKIALRSEYGLLIGESPLVSDATEGNITLNDEKYYFTWKGEMLTIYSKDKIPVQTMAVESEKEPDKMEKFALIFSSLWMVHSNTASGKKEDSLVA
jgi:hypothetical protein